MATTHIVRLLLPFGYRLRPMQPRISPRIVKRKEQISAPIARPEEVCGTGSGRIYC